MFVEEVFLLLMVLVLRFHGELHVVSFWNVIMWPQEISKRGTKNWQIREMQLLCFMYGVYQKVLRA